MIGYLMGEILENSDGKMLVGIGDRLSRNVVGYTVFVPGQLRYSQKISGEPIELFVYTHVREEVLDLYGFVSQLEKSLFLLLLSVNGIGPKGALSILSALESAAFIQAIVKNDQATLNRISGIGKKTAERLVLELRDKVKKKLESKEFSISTERDSFETGLAENTGRNLKSQPGVTSTEVRQDAQMALIGLGFREADVQSLLEQMIQTAESPFQRPEDLIRRALIQMRRVGELNV